MSMRIIRSFYCALLALGCISLKAAVDDPASAVLDELERIDANKPQGISYVVTEKGSHVDRQFRVHQLDEDHMDSMLLLVDGKAPTAAQVAAFQKERAEQARQRKEAAGKGGTIDSLSAAIEKGTLVLARTEGSLQYFDFRPHIEMGDGDTPPQLTGHLVYDTQAGHLVNIEVVNTEPFKPDFKVKIRRFLLAFKFKEVPGMPVVVPASIESDVEGRAMLLVGIDEHYQATFSEYQADAAGPVVD